MLTFLVLFNKTFYVIGFDDIPNTKRRLQLKQQLK